MRENTYVSLSPYQVPAQKMEDLYVQISSYHITDISRKDIRLGTLAVDSNYKFVLESTSDYQH